VARRSLGEGGSDEQSKKAKTPKENQIMKKQNIHARVDPQTGEVTTFASGRKGQPSESRCAKLFRRLPKELHLTLFPQGSPRADGSLAQRKDFRVTSRRISDSTSVKG
jgi:hypothetical protein